MKKTITKRGAAYSFRNILLMAVVLISISAKMSIGQIIYGTTTMNELVSFNATAPNVISSLVPITGITAGQTISGLDFRPRTGELYAFGYNKTAMTYQLYTINMTTGMAMSLNAATAINLGMGPVGFDFNPTVDRIRVVSASGANFRLHPVTGAIAVTDGNLTYKTGDPNFGTTPNIAAVAYTNSYIGAATTSLFDYDIALKSLSLQSPPNDGVLSTIGSSGISPTVVIQRVDMDIFFDETTSSDKAYLFSTTSTSEKMDNLYSVNLSNGVSTLVGAIGGVNGLTNIAALIDRTAPTTTGQETYALSGTNLLKFDTKNPTYIITATPITGVMGRQMIVGMDFRPANNMLYALGYDTANSESQLYTINTTTAVATAVNATPVILSLGKGNIGFDFNPVADKIRVVSNNDMNYRLDPITGGITATDLNINYASTDANTGKDPNVASVAYTNSFANTTTTTLYNYDEVLNVLTTQVPPNNGTLNTVGTSGIMVNSVDASVDLDIFYDGVAMTNMAYLVANMGTESIDRLYSVNLSTGAATEIGKVGFGIPVKDIAIQTISMVTSVSYSAAEGEGEMINVYPSPLADNTFVTIKGESNGTVKVFDISGKNIETLSSNGLSNGEAVINWNTSNLSKGVYFIHYSDSFGKNHVVKLIK